MVNIFDCIGNEAKEGGGGEEEEEYGLISATGLTTNCTGD